FSALIEHGTTAGAAVENDWIGFLNHHLPTRFRAASAFILSANGKRSRQIDIAIYDALYAPPLFLRSPAVHIPVETVHVVFEVKPTFSRQWLVDAADKAASVRALPRRTRNRIHAGLSAKSSVWNPETFSEHLREALEFTKTLYLR